MKKILAVLLLVFVPSYCFAVFPDLNKEQVEEAITYGKELSNKLGQNSDWTLRSLDSAVWVELTTPFSALAQLARDYSLQSKKIREKDIKNAIAPYKNRLIFNYYFYDLGRRFATSAGTDYQAMIRTSDNRIVYPFRGGTVGGLRLEFTFSLAKIDPDSSITFIIREPSGYEHEFPFDLSKIK